MEYVLTQKQMQELDRFSIAQKNVSGLFLMEQAAKALKEEIVRRFPQTAKILIVVESGNNGGDGLALARLLKEQNYPVFVYYIHGIAHCSDSFLQQQRLAEQRKVVITQELPEDGVFDVIVDAVFGVGLKRTVSGLQEKALEWMNRSTAFKIAVDIPSGIHATTAKVLGKAFCADLTVTFGYAKLGLMLYPGKEYAGKVVVRDIGFPKESLWHVKPEYVTFGTGKKAIAQAMQFYPHRQERSNKGTYGHVLCIAGSEGMSGAAYLAAKAAYRCGCGLVRILTPETNRQILQIQLPEAVIVSYHSAEEAKQKLKENWEWADAVMIGSGLSLSDTARELTRTALTYVSEKKGKMPVVVDADSLHILAQEPAILEEYKKLSGEKRPYLIFTPHIKEMSRICGKSVENIAGEMMTTIKEYLEKQQLQGCIAIVLKDARTVVSDGSSFTYLNMTGNHGMATAGAGDVLAGVLVSFLAQQHKTLEKEDQAVRNAAYDFPFEKSRYLLTACMAVCLHGAAGDMARKRVGSVSLMAQDIIDGLLGVMKVYDTKK